MTVCRYSSVPHNQSEEENRQPRQQAATRQLIEFTAARSAANRYATTERKGGSGRRQEGKVGIAGEGSGEAAAGKRMA